MSETQVQAGIVTKLEDEGSKCGSRRQTMVLQVTVSIPMGPVPPARAGSSSPPVLPGESAALWDPSFGTGSSVSALARTTAHAHSQVACWEM